MRKELVRVHARLCGGGHISKYKTSEKDRKFRAEVVYTNFDEENLKEFKQDLSEVFGVNPYLSNNRGRVQVKSIRIVEELERRFGDLQSDKWSIPSEVLELGYSKKLEWLRAFIRDDGYYDEANNRLRIKSMNLSGLEDIKNMMDSMRINSKITGPNCDNSWYLTVSELNAYEKLFQIAKDKKKIRR